MFESLLFDIFHNIPATFKQIAWSATHFHFCYVFPFLGLQAWTGVKQKMHTFFNMNIYNRSVIITSWHYVLGIKLANIIVPTLWRKNNWRRICTFWGKLKVDGTGKNNTRFNKSIFFLKTVYYVSGDTSTYP